MTDRVLAWISSEIIKHMTVFGGFFWGNSSWVQEEKLVFFLRVILLLEIFKAKAELSVSIPKSPEDAEVGAQTVISHVLCQKKVMVPWQQQRFWFVACPSHPRKIKTLELFQLLSWKLLNCAEPLLEVVEKMVEKVVCSIITCLFSATLNALQLSRIFFLLKVNKKPESFFDF